MIVQSRWIFFKNLFLPANPDLLALEISVSASPNQKSLVPGIRFSWIVILNRWIYKSPFRLVISHWFRICICQSVRLADSIRSASQSESLGSGLGICQPVRLLGPSIRFSQSRIASSTSVSASQWIRGLSFCLNKWICLNFLCRNCIAGFGDWIVLSTIRFTESICFHTWTSYSESSVNICFKSDSIANQLHSLSSSVGFNVHAISEFPLEKCFQIL